MKIEISILIADDHPIFRRGLRQVIETDTALKVVSEAEDGETALALIEQLKPDVALLDVDMPKLDGIDVARTLRKKSANVGVIFLTMHKDEDVFNDAMDAGARGYVLKDNAVTDVINCIRAVAAGQHFVSPQLTSYLLNRNNRAASLAKQKPGLELLTGTERRILRLIAENKTSRQIADEMFVSVRTVENHRANMSIKLDLRGAHALLKFALEHKSSL
ncbi:MAG: response regulator transcription factor [Acidobacteria bacterium]|nr:response regulator transcription factor [Acidobacteriota bacterium]MCW5967782.1 response regulator transcription factor [Blastocatellales bacterium]